MSATEFHLDVVSANDTAATLLAEASGLSRQKVKQAMQKGAVWLEDKHGIHRLRRHSRKLLAGSRLHFYYDETVLQQTVPAAELIADEGEFSVWYKPRGMLSQGSKWGDHCAIDRWVQQHAMPEQPVFVVHRLDRFASGLILLAHSKKKAAALARLFQQKQIRKLYRVVVEGSFPVEGMVVTDALDNKPACSRFVWLDYHADKDRTLLEVEIETGRKHQIRRHLASCGHAVVGDRRYGASTSNDDLQLTAYRLEFADSCVEQAERYQYQLDSKFLPQL